MIHFCHLHFPPFFPEHPRTQSSELQLGPSNFRLIRFFYLGTLYCDSASWTQWCNKPSPLPLRPRWSLSPYHAYHCTQKKAANTEYLKAPLLKYCSENNRDNFDPKPSETPSSAPLKGLQRSSSHGWGFILFYKFHSWNAHIFTYLHSLPLPGFWLTVSVGVESDEELL